MCGINPGELTPFQGGPFPWTFPGVETWLKPRADSSPFGTENRPKSSALLASLAFGKNERTDRSDRRGPSPLEKNTTIRMTKPLMTNCDCDWIPIRFIMLSIVAIMSPPTQLKNSSTA
jgi:hypothetical protein